MTQASIFHSPSDTQSSEARPSEALSVSQLNREARYLLEDNFPTVLVEGEISNIATPASGHWYLTLKDDKAQVRCAMFRNRNITVRFKPKNGSQVLLKGKLSLYEGRGDYQLIVQSMEELGDGALRRAFDELKEKLHKEGLFDEENKKILPPIPQHIAVVTSPTGAAIRDIISVLRRRFPSIPVTIVPVTVQGNTASAEIVKALSLINNKQGCLADVDTILLARGGGSLEDLWCFNEESLARAISASEIPVVSAVGHEVDFTIADFVADLRAATPSAAAELVSPDQHDYFQLYNAYEAQLTAFIKERLSSQKQTLQWLTKQLRHPGRRLQEHAQKLDEIETRIQRSFKVQMQSLENKLKYLRSTLVLNSPGSLIKQLQQNLKNQQSKLTSLILQEIQHKKLSLSEQSHALNTVSPLSTLGRGYSIAYDEDGDVITQYDQLNVGDTMTTRLHRGKVESTITNIDKTIDKNTDKTEK